MVEKISPAKKIGSGTATSVHARRPANGQARIKSLGNEVEHQHRREQRQVQARREAAVIRIATALAASTISSTPASTIIVTSQVVPKNSEQSVMLRVSRSKNPMPRKKKWPSGRADAAVRRRAQDRQRPKRRPACR